MKQISAIELSYVIKELQFLIDSKIDKIYQPTKKSFLFQFYVSSMGKYIVKIIIPNTLFLTEYKEDTLESQDYCMFLRKHIGNARLKKIKQLESERIIEFAFETKDKKYFLIIELFSKGNLILCDENHIIINPLGIQKWKDRTIKKGETYNYPKKKFNFLNINEKKVKELFKKTDRDKIVTCLATDLGFGGVYSEELCLLSKIDKNKAPKDVDEKEIKNITAMIKKNLNKKTSPKVIYEDNKVMNVVPCDLEIYKDKKTKKFETFSKAIDYYILEESKLDKKPKTNYEKQLQKIEKIKKKQESRINEININIKENKEKAESIYNNYKLINEILTEIRKARNKHSWKEIKKRLKGHKIIKEINEKEKKIIIELN